jgi:hypothetical protein
MSSILVQNSPTSNIGFGTTTNRALNASFIATPPLNEPLIDTIRVEGEITGHRMPSFSILRTVDRDGVMHDRYTGSRAHLRDAELRVRTRGGQQFAAIERSIPNLLRGDNVIPATLAEAMTAIEDLYGEAATLVDWAVDARGLRLCRLDVDRDFSGVDSVHQLLTGLSALAVPRTSVAHLYNDVRHGGALTLVREVPDSWRATAYDKHRQLLHLADHEVDWRRRERLVESAEAARGRVRYELRARTPALRRQGLIIVSDMTEECLMDLREAYFHRARLDVAVAGSARIDEVMRRLATERDPSYSDFPQVVAMLKAEALGILPPRRSPASLAKYRRLAIEWGLSAADTVFASGPAIALDFEAGVLRTAS